MDKQFKFEISLSVLNHLGRNLYRNIITVIGEAISNSWDADANNVWITIDRDNNHMIIRDDGMGMDKEDFQDKFLRIGYSKRKTGETKTIKGRPFIGRKGIGKLALLSCAERVTVVSKKEGSSIIGGTIDNSELDRAITEDDSHYILQPASNIETIGEGTGTIVIFEDVTNGFFNTIEYMRIALALYFSFSIVDDSFNIFLNDELINEKMLKELSDNTQFCWIINGFKSPFISNQLDCELKDLKINSDISGFVASVKKPSHLKKRGTQDKATIDLFVNGRLREKDILRHIPTSRIVENYVYGQIHCDKLDPGEGKDLFTSSREGIKADEPEFREVIAAFEKAFRIIIDEWDNMRRQQGDDGDPDNNTISKKSRKAEELFNQTMKDLKDDNLSIKRKGKVETWVEELSREAQFNIPSYTECFIAENLLRQYIQYTGDELSQEAKKESAHFRNKEKVNKGKANISFDIRKDSSDLSYLDMDNLANFIDKPIDKNKEAGIGRSAVTYKPIRDAVGHTAVLTQNAKNRLTNEFENIKARLIQVLNEFDNK